MKKYCQYCGKELDENQDVCLGCGKAVNPTIVKNTDPTAKSKMAAGLLAIFLGTFGVHNFYLGYTGKAVTQLLLTILSCGILAPVSAIWGLVEGIQILTGTITTDAEGKPLSE